ncbi:MAG: YeeE/YedE family protein [Candidatus Saccharibacteria bacterium]|nr:YeeE/YedE family protein [Moraxellaceae bacterium]
MNIFFSWLAGLVFGIGLIIAGMTNPAKVLGFLDITGLWDPSLAFVMVGGIAIASIGLLVAKKRTLSFLGLQMRLPTSKHIDRPLILGGMIFGIGWGIAGICPGPALVLVGGGVFKGVIFVIAMIAGMTLFELFNHKKSKQVPKN